jgi:aerobic-type carbon monoxide dehydrogenase small subunit (CoxS/CutS family)
MQVTIDLEVNGERRRCAASPRRRLLDLLRDDLGLTGTKECCGTGDCGACTVLLDGVPINACVYLAAAAHRRRVETIEGLRDSPQMQALADGFAAGGAIQCGFCTPGILVMAVALLRRRADLDGAAVRRHLAGNLCRCTGYVDIIDAIVAAGGAARDAQAAVAGRHA